MENERGEHKCLDCVPHDNRILHTLADEMYHLIIFEHIIFFVFSIGYSYN